MDNAKKNVSRVKVCQGPDCGKAPDGHSYYFCRSCESEVTHALLEQIRQAYNADNAKRLRALMVRAGLDLVGKKHGLKCKRRKKKK